MDHRRLKTPEKHKNGLKTATKGALQVFFGAVFCQLIMNLLDVLGYSSEKQLNLDGSPVTFLTVSDRNDYKLRKQMKRKIVVQ